MTKERKIILVGGAILLLLGAIYRFSPVLEDIFGRDQAIERKKERLAEYQERIRRREADLERMEAVSQKLRTLEARLFTGETNSLIATEIQKNLTTVFSENNLEIDTIRVLNPVEFDGSPYIGIPVQLAFHATVEEMRTILFGIENGEKFLKVSDMRLRLRRTKGGERIRVDLTVRGFAKIPEGASNQPPSLSRTGGNISRGSCC